MQRFAVLLHHLRLDVTGVEPSSGGWEEGATGQPSSTLRRCFDVWTRLVGARGVALLLLEAGCLTPSIRAKSAADQQPTLLAASGSSASNVGGNNKKSRQGKQSQQAPPSQPVAQSTFLRLDAIHSAFVELLDELCTESEFDMLLSSFVKMVTVLIPSPSIDDLARRLLGEEAGNAAPGAWAALVEPLRTQQKMLQAVFHCCFVEVLMSGQPSSFRMPHPLLLLHNGGDQLAGRIVTLGLATNSDRTKPAVMRPFRLEAIDIIRPRSPASQQLGNDEVKRRSARMGLIGSFIRAEGSEAASGSSPLHDTQTAPLLETVQIGNDALVGALWVPGDPAVACLRDVGTVRAMSFIAQRALGHEDARETVRSRLEQSGVTGSAPAERLSANLQLFLLSGLLFAHALPEKAWKATDTISSELSSLLTDLVVNQVKPTAKGMLAMGYSFCLVQPPHHALLVMYGAAAAIQQRAARRNDLSWLYAWRSQIRSHPVLPARLPKLAWEFLSQLDAGDDVAKKELVDEHEGPENSSSGNQGTADGTTPRNRLLLRRPATQLHLSSSSPSTAAVVKRLRDSLDGDGNEVRGGEQTSEVLFGPRMEDSLDVTVKRLWLYAEMCANQHIS